MGGKTSFYASIMSLSSDVTGSCIPCTVRFPNGERQIFIVDCGIFQGKEEQHYNETLPFNPQNVSFALATHVHADHIARFPMMTKKGFRGPIYMTHDSAELLPLALFDSFKIMSFKAARHKIKPTYNQQDVTRTLNQVKGQDYEQWVNINENISFMLLHNSHLVGAASILVRITYPGEQDINLFFTGDWNKHNVFLGETIIPDWVKEIPRLIVIQEATYGTTYSNEVVPCFKKNISQAAKNGDNIVIPVFSLGRSQDVLYNLTQMQLDKSLPSDIPIIFGGKLAHAYTAKYTKRSIEILEEVKDFLPKNLQYLNGGIRQVMGLGTQGIFVVTGGMGSHGVAPEFIKHFLPHANALIHFTGYCTEGTLGREIKDAPIGTAVNVRGNGVQRNANVEYTSEFSGHAKVDEMMKFLKEFHQIQTILLTHGSTTSKETFAEYLKANLVSKRVEILNRETYFRVDGWGNIIDQKPSKF